MKPPVFEYHAPETLEEAVALLAEHGDEAKVLAGGQSLVPAMNFRLARPEILIDIGRISGLSGIERRGDHVRIGTMTRQRVVERNELVAAELPLVAQTMPWVAHPQIRNRGTFGGSLAHADPAAELPAVLRALGGRCIVSSIRGTRTVEADDFYTGLFETALDADEILTAVELPVARPDQRFAFLELSRRHGDFALCGVAVSLTVQDDTVTDARVALLSVGDRPVLAASVGAALVGQSAAIGKEELLAEAAAAVQQDIDPPGDLHAGPAYRRRLAEVLTRRALEKALA